MTLPLPHGDDPPSDSVGPVRGCFSAAY